MELIIILVVGLIAALLMFCGDMLLYYDKRDYASDGMFNSVIEIMKNVSEKRFFFHHQNEMCKKLISVFNQQ